MKRIALLSLISFLIALNGLGFALEAGNKIEVKGEWLYLNGEKFFVKGVGYAGWRPGQMEGSEKVDPKLMESDFKQIKEGGFNTIRTWAALAPEELSLARKYGLYVIQGIWIDPTHDYSEDAFVAQALEQIKKEVSWSKGFDNVIMYLVITEPTQEAVLYAGEEEATAFFRKIKDTIRKIDDKPVSMDSWIPLGFMDHSMWDAVTFNVFMFAPESINRAIGFKEYVKWIKENHAADKTLVIGETGGFSVSKNKLNDIGFGGNDEAGQSKGDIDSVNKAIAGGATGVCTVAWVDVWHYPSDTNTHDDHPWEWDGLLGIPTKNDMEGIPRQVYNDFKAYNHAIVIEPKEAGIYHAAVPVSVYADESANEIKYRVDNAEPRDLAKQSDHWWTGKRDLKEGNHTLEITCLDGKGAVLTRRSVEFYIADKIETLKPGIKIAVIPDKQVFSTDEAVSLRIKLTDRNGVPVVKGKVSYGLFAPLGWKEEFGSGLTNEAGELPVKATLKLNKQTQRLLVSAGYTDAKDAAKRQYSVIEFLQIKAPQKGAGDGKKGSFRPFTVYEEKNYPGNHFIPSGWAGDHEDLRLNDNFRVAPHSGDSCIRVAYSAKASHGGGWAAIYWQNPLNNWGQIKDGFDLKGASRLTFWARGENGGEKIEEFGMGWLNGNYPDSDAANTKLTVLTKDWKQYTIDISKKNLDHISCGFYLLIQKYSNPQGCVFYLDDITYE